MAGAVMLPEKSDDFAAANSGGEGRKLRGPGMHNPVVFQPWALRGSAWRVYLISFLIAAGIFAVTTVLHYIISPAAETITKQPLADLLAALLVGLMAYRSYTRRRERIRLVYSRLQMIAEMNHHVRNALQTITLRIYSTGDRKLIDDVATATRRIDWALREILSGKKDKL